MMKNSLYLSFLLGLATMLLSGCFNPELQSIKDSGGTNWAPQSSSGTQNEEITSSSEVPGSVLFVKNNAGHIEFSTSDKKFWSVRGFTLWKFSKAQPSEKIKLKVRKMQGVSSSGYGLVCYRHVENPEDEANKKDIMLCILININGQYAIGKSVNGRYTDIQYWKEHSSLVRGYNENNSIETEYSGNEIKISFNGQPAYTVFNTEEPKLKAQGNYGYIAVISSHDNFPRKRVEVFFSEE